MSSQEKSPKRAPDDGWARSGKRLKVGQTSAKAMNLNVDGRSVNGPLQGFGQLWQKSYRVPLAGATVTPQEVVRVWKERFPEFHSSENRFYPSLAGIEPGEVLLINAMTPGGPVSTGVMVLYADDESFTLMTPEGHPESGWITFSAFKSENCTVAQVQSIARANDPIYEAAFRVLGSAAQEQIWRYVLTSLARHFGVTAPAITVDKTCVDPMLQWSQAKNMWHNAQIRTLMYYATSPVRWVRGIVLPKR